MLLTLSLLCFLYVATSATTALLPRCPDTSSATYDYVVVGAGAGGGPVAARLAEYGFSVLVIDAGHNVSSINTTIPLYFVRVLNDPEVELNYTVHEYPAEFKVQNNDSWYPRARALGGSTIHNALVNVVTGTKDDFDSLAAMFKDDTWSFKNMRNYFKRIEHNLYINPPNADHGYEGWLKTNLNPASVLEDPSSQANPQMEDIVGALLTSSPMIDDLNSPSAIERTGISVGSVTADENHIRSSVYNRLFEVDNSSEGRLEFSFDTLATKVLLCQPREGAHPRAYGVEFSPGAALAVASNFHGKSVLKTETVFARREIIVSAGVFQSPQLLMLSGIGDKNQLEEHGIETVVDLPGVGKNLQDHDEISTIWHLKKDHRLWDGCVLGDSIDVDPCLAAWEETGHQNLYSFGVALALTFWKSLPDLEEPDMVTYWAPGHFPGFLHGVGEKLSNTHNALTAVSLRAHSSSQGFVRLTGAHPQDGLQIQKLHFQAEGGLEDVAILREGIKNARHVVGHPDIWKHVESEVFPGPRAQTDEQIENHVYEYTFGHHACCTNKMGLENDKDAVLDGDFKVRGVSNLRVVDLSSWPKVPGFFVTTPMYMMAEKAADVIISAAETTPVLKDQSHHLGEL